MTDTTPPSRDHGDGLAFDNQQRPHVPELDAILGKPFRVLDDGFVRVVDYMGSDASIVQAARVSYGAGTKKINEDRGLIRYLLRHSHTTPLEMCELKLHVRVPMDCWRQWIRHRTANVNEYSTRYSEAIGAAQRTPPDRWRKQSAHNRQGSGEYLDPTIGTKLSDQEFNLQRLSRAEYQERLDSHVAREQARKDLPLSTYTEAYWKIDLHNLLHFLRLRMETHAQEEIRQYAYTIGQEIVARWCPLAWTAFLDYELHSTRLSRTEAEVVALLAKGSPDKAIAALERQGILERTSNGIRVTREALELEAKLKHLDIPVPWAPLSL